jgi:hypothetical protein
VARPAAIRSRAFLSRSEGQAPPLRLYAVRCRPAHLRRQLRHGRGQDHPRHAPVTGALPRCPKANGPRRSRASRFAPKRACDST